MSSPRQLTIHPSLTAPDLSWGAERHLVWPFWTLVVCVLYVGFLSWKAWVVGVLVGGLGHWGLVTVAKIDPLWSRVYWRSLRYQSVYYPHPRMSLRRER